MKEYKTLLFDADNTLLDFDMSENRALRATFAMYNLPFTSEIKTYYLTINRQLWNAYEEGQLSREDVIYTRFDKLFTAFGIKEDGVAFETMYQKQLGNGHDLIAHAYETVNTLHKQFDLYIASNGIRATQYARLRDSGLQPFMKGVFISEEVNARKPMPEFFTYCFAHIPGIDLKKTLIIGDSLSSDMQGGDLGRD